MKTFPPTPDSLRAYLEQHELSSTDVAKMLKLGDGSTVRHWRNGKSKMSFANWFTLRSILEPDFDVDAHINNTDQVDDGDEWEGWT